MQLDPDLIPDCPAGGKCRLVEMPKHPPEDETMASLWPAAMNAMRKVMDCNKCKHKMAHRTQSRS